MKKNVLLAMALCIIAVCGAQTNNDKALLDVGFYGIDFSEVNVIGATETQEKFITAFEGMNWLLINEPRKYDVGRCLGYNIKSLDLDCALSQIEKLHNVTFKKFKSSGVDVNGIISNYPDEEGTFLLIIAQELNKVTTRGTFVAVLFDGKSKQIISEEVLDGKARGYGLRNFWAGALYNGLKAAKRNLTNYYY